MPSLLEKLRRVLGLGSGPSEMDAFRAILVERDNGVYEKLFGRAIHGSIATLSPDLLRSLFSDRYDPRWLHDGIYVYEPVAERQYWTYVTAGLSTPWGLSSIDELPVDPAKTPSGLGKEFILRTPQFSDWAMSTLSRLIARECGLFASLLSGTPASVGACIPLELIGASPDGSGITALVVARPRDVPDSFVIRSGRVKFLLLIGITAEEYTWSTTHGTDALVTALHSNGLSTTDLDRTTMLAIQCAAVPG